MPSWAILGEPGVDLPGVPDYNKPPDTRKKRFHITFKEKHERYLQQVKDYDTPVNGHEMKILRKQLGLPDHRFAKMLRCSKSHVNWVEQGRTTLAKEFRIRYHRISRFTAMALDDMRDRFEMPDFSK